jgi:YebC/PmpR family DNA-binding regulatory protein
MSGHSKWSTIKRQKGAADAKRSANFTKLANAITIAARDGGGDPSSNFKLRLATEKAREANMPKDNIERAIKRGTGELDGAVFAHVLYEAYAPGGVALLIDVNTDNRNRAIAGVKSVLNKHGAKLAESGAVGYLFEPTGVMTLSSGQSEALEMAIIDSGATDYEPNNDIGYTVYTEVKETAQVAQHLQGLGYAVNDIELSQEPKSTVAVSDPKISETLMKLMSELEEMDDVSAVYTNFESIEQ